MQKWIYKLEAENMKLKATQDVNDEKQRLSKMEMDMLK